nr:hypothetical protein BaRGS_005993 [Batillaria attramentaria]
MLRIVRDGENVQVGQLEVHVMSAIHRRDYPQPDAFNLLAPGLGTENVWAIRHRLGVSAAAHRPLSKADVKPSLLPDPFKFVTFAEDSCDVNTTLGREIAFPPDGRNKFAACVRPAYGDVDPVRLVEWMEMAKLVGVDVVQVSYHIVSKRTLDVLLYYESTGFVILAPVTPAVRKGVVSHGCRD